MTIHFNKLPIAFGRGSGVPIAVEVPAIGIIFQGSEYNILRRCSNGI